MKYDAYSSHDNDFSFLYEKKKIFVTIVLETGLIQIAIKDIRRKYSMASVDFLLQGLNETEDHYAAVEQLLCLPNISYCLIGTAFMNAAGAAMVVNNLSAIAPNLQLIVERVMYKGENGWK